MSTASQGHGVHESVARHLNLTACSSFGGSSQPLMVNSHQPGANVRINGTQAGRTPLQYQVARRDDLRLEYGNQSMKPSFDRPSETLAVSTSSMWSEA